jgi:hypothetical protein
MDELNLKQMRAAARELKFLEAQCRQHFERQRAAKRRAGFGCSKINSFQGPAMSERPLLHAKLWRHPHRGTRASSRAEVMQNRLVETARKLGIFASEQKVREAIGDGRYAEASRLRN